MKAARPFIAHCLLIIVLALTNVGFASTLLGCGPAAVHVAPATSTSFQQMMAMEVTADARRPAHWMERYVRGDQSANVHVLYDDKLPEAYTQDEPRRGWRSEYHLAYAALRLLREFYAAANPTHRALEDGHLVEVVDEAGGNLYMLNEFDKDRRPDIADVDGRFVFEVVPPGEAHQAAGKKKVDWHLLLINNAMLGVPTFKLGTGYAGEVGVRFAEDAPPWKLSWQTVEPGVISYQWQVLSVGDANKEVYGKAYLDNRWHEPTAHEMVRFARALHEVVERLVQAREGLGQTRADATMPILPGKTRVDYARSVQAWGAYDDKVARLLPVMRKPPPPPAPVRPDRRFIGETVIPQVPNEGYTTDGKPGSKPFHFHLGSSAHKIIAMHYMLQQPDKRKVAMNFMSIKTIVREAGGVESLVLPSEALLRPDIADWGDLTGNVVFEIKPDRANNLVEGQTIVAKYLAALNRGMVGKKLFTLGVGFHGNVGVMFADGLKRWNLTWRTASPGVILYKLRRLGVSAQDQATAEAIKRAQDEGRWVDLTVKARIDKAYQEAYENDQWVEMTEAEMEPYAEQLEEAVDLIVGDRELILELQDMVNVPIEIVGRISTDILSAELFRHFSSRRTIPPAKVSPATVPRRAIPQNDNGVPSSPRAPAPPPRMTPPVYKPKKAA